MFQHALTVHYVSSVKDDQPNDNFILYKPAYDKTHNKTFETSENSDQPAHPESSLIEYALYSLQAI